MYVPRVVLELHQAGDLQAQARVGRRRRGRLRRGRLRFAFGRWHHTGLPRGQEEEVIVVVENARIDKRFNKSKHVAQQSCTGLSKVSLKLLSQLRANFASPCSRRYASVKDRK